MTRRTVLMVSYFYAPLANPGTRRVGAFARYLPLHGYDTAILATDKFGVRPDDADRRVFRAADPLELLTRPLRRRSAGGGGAGEQLVAAGSRAARLLDTLMVPDVHAGWYGPAVLRGLPLVRSGGAGLIFSSSPTVTNHLVALRLKRASGLPWVADFRDGWLFEPPNPAPLSSPLRRRLEQRLEQAVVRNADRIVAVNAAIADDLARRYGVAPRTVVVSNGYDPADFVGLRRVERHSARMRLVYTGAFARSRDGTSIQGLLDALRLLHERRSPAAALEVVLAGGLTDAERAMIQRSNLGGCVTLHGQVAHRQALQLQLDADVLLLVTAPRDASVTTSKLFEYLAADRPILALARGTAAGELVGSLGAGLVVAPDKPGAIAQAIEHYHALWRQRMLPGGAGEQARRYDRRVLTGQLATLFDELAGAAVEVRL
jgi:glycosyltransferase involved in cell wall biosynthesis